jgi:TDG/mug DNA glycosylase family protein
MLNKGSFLKIQKLINSDKSYTNITYQISSDCKILFIGTNPSPGSYQNGVPFSSNKSFWYLLQAAGLLPESKDDLQNNDILKKMFTTKFSTVYHLGLINLIYRPTKGVSQVTYKEAVPGSLRIMAAIRHYSPKVVCFVGKGTYQLFSQTRHCDYGWQKPIEQSKAFVMHTPIHGFAHIRVKELKEITNAASL